ncbi:FHA domain-containing protein [Actinomyces respiraculi]|uniref:FHA domain-containing protein n=1 Tax=Actinomyces respiraculi TaxID=2744574 RepID=UPI00142020AF|nr:FHA domain-containing protein [Actinomyces respiraculi]
MSEATVPLGDDATRAAGPIEVSGPLGSAHLHPHTPADVVEKIRDLLSHAPQPDEAAHAGPSATTADAAPDLPVLEEAPATMTWSEEDEARADETSVQVAPAPDYPRPAPGSGRRRRPSAASPGTPESASPGHPAPAAPPGPESPAAIPLVWGRLCADAHVSPPDADRCLVCSAPLTGERCQVPTPVLMVLFLSTGQRVPVRGEVVVGRAPQPCAAGGSLLVPVSGPTGVISRSHLLVSTAGWSVLARDLGSHNGTVLLRPGIAPVLLGSTVPCPLLVGDLLDIGDGVTIRLDPPDRP